MQETYKYDQTVINDDNNINYIDNQQLINIKSNNNINNENYNEKITILMKIF
ncbi:hypothetical protein [Spiroplasma endosymbiont of Polydrusus formosus]|uniref:hypothetical protein n=1 Tax=Spiroplasma endosymbiont of Polydrusus formosus TaxID=3139326 RepID=UPI0035B565AA